MSGKIKSLFPTLISQGVLPGAKALNEALLQEIDDFYRRDKFGRDWSKQNYRGGYTSYGSLSDMHRRSPVFMKFEELLEPFAKQFAKANGWNTRGLRLEMNACWMNVMKKNAYHTLHLHPHSAISGAYYVSIPEGSVSLKIEDPRMSSFMSAPVRDLYYEVRPTAGSFIMFESWLRHEVPPNQSNEPRVSLSFNYSFEDDD